MSVPSETAARTPASDEAGLCCPRCGLEQPAASECLRCGVIFARLLEVTPRDEAASRVTVVARDVVDPAIERRAAVRSVAIGGGLAAVATMLAFPRFVFSYLTILVHELGHAATGWLFGYPSIPAFDFVYGGGVTSMQDRQVGVLILWYAAIAGALWFYRRHPPGYLTVGAIALVHAALAVTPLHRHAIQVMGHGAELIFAGIFLYRAISGTAIKVPAERPLYAFVGWFILLNDLRFAWGLTFSPLQRDIYGEQKGGGHWMDFSVLSQDLGLSLESVAGMFLLATVAAAPLTLGIFLQRESIGRLLTRCLGRPER